MTKKLVTMIIGAAVFSAQLLPAMADDKLAAAKKEGQYVSYGMSDDCVNLVTIFANIESKYALKHVDTDMTSAEQITHLLAEKDAPVMDIADIGYDFTARLLENGLAASYKNTSWDSIKPQYKDPEGRWAASYWGAIARSSCPSSANR